jgi:tRNA (guanine37-N1)-methyltransferase
MIRFDILTLMPELFEPHWQHGITQRAYASGQVQVQLWPLREYGEGPYRRVDDRPFGGGPGMVMLAQPLEKALLAVQAHHHALHLTQPRPLIYFTPTGEPMQQKNIEAIAAAGGATLLCGRYEGVDQRFIDRYVTHEWSLGDFVLSGGEIPALALLDAVARLQPGVLNDPQSHQQDSFAQSGLLDCPHYSRPEQLLGWGDYAAVPPVLTSGHHGAIARWRRERSLTITAKQRPDLIVKARNEGLLDASDEKYLRKIHST